MKWQFHDETIEFTPQLILKYNGKFYTLVEFQPYDFLPMQYALLENQIGDEDDWELFGEMQFTKDEAVEQIPGLLIKSTVATIDDMKEQYRLKTTPSDYEKYDWSEEDGGIYGYDLG